MRLASLTCKMAAALSADMQEPKRATQEHARKPNETGGRDINNMSKTNTAKA